MEDVLDLYEEPYDPQYATVCLDEKPVVLHVDVLPPVKFVRKGNRFDLPSRRHFCPSTLESLSK